MLSGRLSTIQNAATGGISAAESCGWQEGSLPPHPHHPQHHLQHHPQHHPQQLGGVNPGVHEGGEGVHEAAGARPAVVDGRLGEAVPRSVTGPMIAAMQGSDDPRFEQSQLLDMLRQLDAGRMRLGEGDLNGAAQAQLQPPAATSAAQATRHELDAAWGEAGAAGAVLQAGSPLQGAWSQAGGELEGEDVMLQSWHDALREDGIDSSLPEMEALWAALKGGEHGDFEAAWDSSAEAEHGDYSFAPSNPYLGHGVPGALLALGTELFARGELSQAVLALEAAVQLSPEDSIAWQTLGQTHADSDEDSRAICCLRRAVSSDPHNLEALLALGVSYTNELDQSRALHHLQHWLESHPDFASLGLAVEPGAKANPFRLQQQATR